MNNEVIPFRGSLGVSFVVLSISKVFLCFGIVTGKSIYGFVI